MQMKQPLFRVCSPVKEKFQVCMYILAFLPGSDSFALFIHPTKKTQHHEQS
jgi:hypothetical protein